MFRIDEPWFDEDGERTEKYDEYVSTLLEEFASSPEAKPLIDAGASSGWAEMMIEFGGDYLGASPATMSPGNFNEVLYELFPRKVSTEADKAADIVNELKAFWQFLHRQYGLKNAARIEATLGPDAIHRLEKELANPANYGMAKSFFMLGQKSGFDMTTQEGMAAFQASYNSQVLSRGPGALGGLPPMLPDFADDEGLLPPPGGGMTPKQRAEKRKARKRQRQARKRNRK